MGQWVKWLQSKEEGLGLIPGTHKKPDVVKHT